MTPTRLNLLLFSLLCFSFFETKAQDEPQSYQLTLGAYAESFYVYDFNEPEGGVRQPFFFNHNRHNEFNVNMGLIRVDLDHEKYRAKLALQAGTYPQDNYAAEQDLLKNIFEANVGVSLNNNNSLWLDAGIMPSHLGFESPFAMDNPTMTRSLSAENSPYFLTGVKLTFNPTERLTLAGLVVNGWQRITRVEGNSLPSFGTQVQYQFSEKVMLNWSTFIGSDFPDAERRMRYFNDLYLQFQWSKFSLITGFDIGIQQKEKGSEDYDIWWVPTLIAQYRLHEKWQMAVRGEYFYDEKEVIISSISPDGFQTAGLSFNIDYLPSDHIICRLEGRWLQSMDMIFEKEGNLRDYNLFVGTSIAMRIGERLK